MIQNKHKIQQIYHIFSHDVSERVIINTLRNPWCNFNNPCPQINWQINKVYLDLQMYLFVQQLYINVLSESS